MHNIQRTTAYFLFAFFQIIPFRLPSSIDRYTLLNLFTKNLPKKPHLIAPQYCRQIKEIVYRLGFVFNAFVWSLPRMYIVTGWKWRSRVQKSKQKCKQIDFFFFFAAKVRCAKFICYRREYKPEYNRTLKVPLNRITEGPELHEIGFTTAVKLDLYG